MFKKIAAVSALVCILVSFSACYAGGGKGVLDEQSRESFARIADYLGEAESYFSVAEAMVVLKSAEDRDKCLDVFVESAGVKKELPKELVDGYVESFKTYFESEASGGEKGLSLREEAEALIKREMVVYIEAVRFACDKISPADEAAKAEELAKLYGVKSSDFYKDEAADESGEMNVGENYTVKAAIWEERVKACLEEIWDGLH